MTNRYRGRAKRGLIDFLTNGRVIQAFLTGSTFGVLNRLVNLVAQGVGPTEVRAQTAISALLMAVVASFWYWADRNQGRFESVVEDAAGE